MNVAHTLHGGRDGECNVLQKFFRRFLKNLPEGPQRCIEPVPPSHAIFFAMEGYSKGAQHARGVAPTTCLAGTLFVITQPAPTIAPLGTPTPDNKITQCPIHISFQIRWAFRGARQKRILPWRLHFRRETIAPRPVGEMVQGRPPPRMFAGVAPHL